MDSNGVQGRRYRLVLRGELGDAFGILFDSMQLCRLLSRRATGRRSKGQVGGARGKRVTVWWIFADAC
jgi:hypothetical protein